MATRKLYATLNIDETGVVTRNPTETTPVTDDVAYTNRYNSWTVPQTGVWAGDGNSLTNLPMATTGEQGCVYKTGLIADVSSPLPVDTLSVCDVNAPATYDNTWEQMNAYTLNDLYDNYPVIRTLLNELKTQLNTLISELRSAGIITT